jgi:hypothetical protein
MRHPGRCHCGNLTVAFETTQSADRVSLRACLCTFCRRHGAVWTADPSGRLDVRVGDPALLSRYRFGLGTSEFLVCRTCGVPVAAVAEIDGATYAALNANVLEDRPTFTQPPQPVDYDAEAAEDRIARRRRAWTPATIR